MARCVPICAATKPKAFWPLNRATTGVVCSSCEEAAGSRAFWRIRGVLFEPCASTSRMWACTRQFVRRFSDQRLVCGGVKMVRPFCIRNCCSRHNVGNNLQCSSCTLINVESVIGVHPLDGLHPPHGLCSGFRFTLEGIPPDDIYKGDLVGILIHISNLQNVELTRKGGSHDWSWSD